MKGAIAVALKEMVVENYGEQAWKSALNHAGITTEPILTLLSNIDDALMMKIIDGVCKTLNISQLKAFDAFGEYWMLKFAPSKYPSHIRGANNAKEFLLKMDSVHDFVTKNMDNAHPPRFQYEWKDQNTLIMNYKSQRGLIDLLVSLIKGVGKYYKENLMVTKLSNTQVQIKFL